MDTRIKPEPVNPRSIVDAILHLVSFCVNIVLSFYTLGLWQIVILVFCVPAVCLAKSRRVKAFALNGLLSVLAFWGYALLWSSLSRRH